MEDTRIKDLYKAIQNSGIDTYFPGQHKGECIKPYAVVKPSISTPYLEYSSMIHYVDVLCYVPDNQFSTLETLVKSVEKAVRDELFPTIKNQHEYTEPFYDDSVKGWMQKATFVYYTKIYSDLYQK